MKDSTGSTIGAVVMLLALPAAFVVLWSEGLRLGYRLGLRGEMVRTTGVVIQTNTWTESGDTYQSPVVQLTTQNGRQLAVDLWCPPFGCFSKNDIGTRVPVIYPRDHAQESTVMADTLQGWAAELLMLLIGCVMAAGGGSAARHLYAQVALRFKVRTGGWSGSV